jgi:diguanylate cyclase (GGDEF)-like protein/PAS domain S-box-containing protein
MTELSRAHPLGAPHAAGALLLMLGTVVLYGWARESATLTSVFPRLPAMMPNTAVGILLLGTGMLGWHVDAPAGDYATRLAGGLAAALGLVTLTQYLTGLDFGIDRLLFASQTGTAPIHGRMALATAASFALAGSGLVLQHRGGRRAVIAGQALALAVLALGSMSLLGYLFGAQAPGKLVAFSTMALHTTFGFLVAGTGLLYLRPAEGLMRDLTSDTLGATVLRLLLPGAVLLPLLIAYLRLLGQQAGWYGTEFALALYVTVQGVVLVTGLWLVSRWLTHTDAARREVAGENRRLIAKLREAGAALESKVALRTRELAESEAKFRSLLGLLSDWYWEQDEALRFRYVSEGYERQTGLKSADSLGKTRFGLAGAFESQVERARHEADLAARRPFRDLRMRWRTAGGEERVLSVSGEPVFDADGRFRGYRGVGRDVTVDEAAERGRQLLASIVEHVHDAVICRSLDGTVLSWNRGAERMYGYRAEEMLGANVTPLMFQGDKQILEEQNRRLLAGEEGFEDVAQRRAKGNVPLEASVIISALRDRSGHIVGAVSISRDISALAQAHRALLEADRRLALAMSIARVETWEIDVQTGAMHCSDGVGPILGRARGFQLGHRLAWREAIRPSDRQRVADLFEAAVAGRAEYDVEYAFVRADGSEGWLSSRCVFERDARGQAVRALGVMVDITERHHYERQLFAEKELAQVTLRSIGDAVITTDTDRKVRELNPVAEQLTGWPADQARGRDLSEVFHVISELDRTPVTDPVARVLDSGQIACVEDSTLLVSRDGREASIADSAAPIKDRQGNVIGAVLVFHDVTEERRVARALRFQAAHDVLTGLINRREFELRLEQALERAAVDSTELALCYIDLDQFKVVNDTCGHAAGDELLRQVTALLQSHLRRRDTLARLGGDEFGLLLENCSEPVAARVTGELLEALRGARFTWGSHVFRMGASIGVALASRSLQTMAQALSAADAACYAAKEAGRGRVKFYRATDEDLARRMGEMTWVSRIHGALEDGRFALYGQPVVPVQPAQPPAPRYCEVLARLLEPDGQLVSPGAFIPAAERYGLMPRIDQWVLKALLEQLARAPAAQREGIVYGVNLSGLTLNQEGMLAWLTGLLRDHAIAPSLLCFEITETTAISNLALAREFIVELKRLGCRFALDDFGSGMSSFNYLRNLSVDYLKIDGAFVVDAARDPINRAMVDAINRVGRTIGIQTIAEWVEEEATLALMREIGVDYVQGFAVAHPQPLAELLAEQSVRRAFGR